MSNSIAAVTGGSLVPSDIGRLPNMSMLRLEMATNWAKKIIKPKIEPRDRKVPIQLKLLPRPTFK